MWQFDGDPSRGNFLGNGSISGITYLVMGTATVTINGNIRMIDRLFLENGGDGDDDMSFSVDSEFSSSPPSDSSDNASVR